MKFKTVEFPEATPFKKKENADKVCLVLNKYKAKMGETQTVYKVFQVDRRGGGTIYVIKNILPSSPQENPPPSFVKIVEI